MQKLRMEKHKGKNHNNGINEVSTNTYKPTYIIAEKYFNKNFMMPRLIFKLSKRTSFYQHEPQ